jgi:hypothetical protein
MEFHPEANQVEYVICPAELIKAEKAIDIALKKFQKVLIWIVPLKCFKQKMMKF